MDKLSLIKTTTNTIVAAGVGAVVGNAVKATTPPGLKGLSKLYVGVGSIVVTTIIADLATKYTNMKFDNAIAAYSLLTHKEKEQEIDPEIYEDVQG